MPDREGRDGSEAALSHPVYGHCAIGAGTAISIERTGRFVQVIERLNSSAVG